MALIDKAKCPNCKTLGTLAERQNSTIVTCSECNSRYHLEDVDLIQNTENLVEYLMKAERIE